MSRFVISNSPDAVLTDPAAFGKHFFASLRKSKLNLGRLRWITALGWRLSYHAYCNACHDELPDMRNCWRGCRSEQYAALICALAPLCRPSDISKAEIHVLIDFLHDGLTK